MTTESAVAPTPTRSPDGPNAVPLILHLRAPQQQEVYASSPVSALTEQPHGLKRSAPADDGKPNEGSAKRQTKWTAQENSLITQLRGTGMKWDDVSKHLPGRSSISCRLHYQNFLERRAEWTEEQKTKLARLYDRHRREMWQQVAKDLEMPWRAVEAMHWELGIEEMAKRAGVTPFNPVSSGSHSSAGVAPAIAQGMGPQLLPAYPQAQYYPTADVAMTSSMAPQAPPSLLINPQQPPPPLPPPPQQQQQQQQQQEQPTSHPFTNTTTLSPQHFPPQQHPNGQPLATPSQQQPQLRQQLQLQHTHPQPQLHHPHTFPPPPPIPQETLPRQRQRRSSTGAASGPAGVRNRSSSTRSIGPRAGNGLRSRSGAYTARHPQQSTAPANIAPRAVAAPVALANIASPPMPPPSVPMPLAAQASDPHARPPSLSAAEQGNGLPPSRSLTATAPPETNHHFSFNARPDHADIPSLSREPTRSTASPTKHPISRQQSFAQGDGSGDVGVGGGGEKESAHGRYGTWNSQHTAPSSWPTLRV